MQVVDQILVMHKVRTRQGERNQSYCCSGGFDKETSRHLCKKQKISSAIGRDAGSGLQSSGGVCISHAFFTFNSGFIFASPKVVLC